MKSEQKTFKKNLILAIISQMVSSGAGVLVSFIVPKFLGIREYGFWQLFLMYVAYVNICSLGLFDGLYLRHGGENYDELDYSLLGTQWRIHSLIQIVVASVLGFIVTLMNIDPDRKVALIACCISIPIINSNDYFGRLLQAVNRTNIYSISVILFNAMWFVGVGILYFGHIYSYKVIIYAYLAGQVLSGMYMMLHARKVIFAKHESFSSVFEDMKQNIKVGICLFAAMYASQLIIGSVRMIVDQMYGIELFSKVSFAMSIMYFALRFLQQVAMVMFPALKRVSKERSVELFSKTNTGLSIVLPLVLFGYFPAKLILSLWLPQYADSMIYLAYVLPICVFDGKMQMLYATYYKVLRKEKELLLLNVSTLIESVITTIILLAFTKNIGVVMIGTVVTIASRSVRAYRYLCNEMNIRFKTMLPEFIFITIFIVVTSMLTDVLSIVLCIFAYIFLVVSEKYSS